MNIIPLLRFLIPLTLTPLLLASPKVTPQPVYTVDLSKLISQELDINPAGTLTFVTENILAVSICRNLRCNLETLDLKSGTPRVIARSNEFQNYSALFRVTAGRVMLDRVRSGNRWEAVVLDSNLQAPSLIPEAAGIDQRNISSTGDTFVKQNQEGWVAYRTVLPPARIREGNGSVLSVSDDAVAYVDKGTIQVEGMEGKHLGSFRVNAKALPTISFLGPDRLWSEAKAHPEILDFNGRVVQSMKKQDGWGFRIGQSSDGSRMLFDRYTRNVPLGQKISEAAIAIATLGMGVGDEEANGETVVVIDTKNGKKCFEWSSRTDLLLEGHFHADIDPSGRLIAIMSRNWLNFYKLPADCSAQ